MQYQRILLKISGEALMGEGSYGISSEMIEFVAREIRSVVFPVQQAVWTAHLQTIWVCWPQ